MLTQLRWLWQRHVVDRLGAIREGYGTYREYMAYCRDCDAQAEANEAETGGGAINERWDFRARLAAHCRS